MKRTFALVFMLLLSGTAIAQSFVPTTPALTYGDLLHLSHGNAGVDGTFRLIYDGLGNATGVSISTLGLSLANPLGVASGGVGSSLVATGPGFLRQATSGANVTVSTLAAVDLPAGGTWDSGSTALQIASTGGIGLGTVAFSSPAVGAIMVGNTSDTSQNRWGAEMLMGASPTSDSTRTYTGLYSYVVHNTNYNLTGGLVGMNIVARKDTGSGTVASAVGAQIDIDARTGTTITTATAINLLNYYQTGSIGTWYGIRFPTSIGATTKYSIYSDDTTQTMIHAGWASIGKATPPATALDVNGTVTATAFSGAGTNLTGTAASLAAGTAATVTGAAQSSITSVGTLASLTVSGAATVGSLPMNTAPGNGNYYGKVMLTQTAGAALAAGDVVYLKSADSKWYDAKADAASTSGPVLLGVCPAAIGSGSTGVILIDGVMEKTGWALTAGSAYYVSPSTAGAVTVTVPSTSGQQVRVVGHALSTVDMYFHPSVDWGQI